MNSLSADRARLEDGKGKIGRSRVRLRRDAKLRQLEKSVSFEDHSIITRNVRFSKTRDSFSLKEGGGKERKRNDIETRIFRSFVASLSFCEEMEEMDREERGHRSIYNKRERNNASRRFLVIKMEHGQADSLMDELPDSRLSQ